MALVTTAFWDQADFVARAVGMTTAPRLELPHPIAGTGQTVMARVAAELAPRIVAALRGAS